MAGKLDLDIGSRVSELEVLMNRFMVKRVLYNIIFRGKGLEFDGYRDFSPDEDASNIDWKASVRADKLLAKKYIEERDLNIMFVIDMSEMMLFGSEKKLKCEYAAEIAASIAHLIVTAGDNIGFIFFNRDVIKVVPPKSGERQFNIFVNDLYNSTGYSGISNFDRLFDFLINKAGSNISTVILISDFLKLGKKHESSLKLISEKYETIAVMVRDVLDENLPNIKGEFVIRDPDTGENLVINPSIARKSYERHARKQKNEINKIFLDSQIDVLEIMTNVAFVPVLVQFLVNRIENKKFVTPRR